MGSNTIRSVAVIGTGQMGPGIAQACAVAGYTSVIIGRSDQSLDRARSKVDSNLATMVKFDLVQESALADIKSRISYRKDGFAAAADVDLVIEGVNENLQLKQELFAELEAVCRPDTILASTTSGLRAVDIAAKLQHPERVIVAHYWNPPHLIPLVEVVPGPKTNPDVTETVMTFLKSTGHKPVLVAKDCLGFIGVRLQAALQREAISMVAQGIATPEEIDTAIKTSFGARLPVYGVFEHMDIVGLDLISYIHDYLLVDLANDERSNPVLKEKVGRGEIGVKSGKGFLDWSVHNQAEVIRIRDTELLERARKNKQPQ